jgi:hypothetical protein
LRRRRGGTLRPLPEQRADLDLASGLAVDGGQLRVVAEAAARGVECVLLGAGEVECRLERVLPVDDDLVQHADRLEGAGERLHEPAEVATGVWNVCDGDEVDGVSVKKPSSSLSSSDAVTGVTV